MMGALLLSLSAPAMAQNDAKATIETVAQLIKSKPADLDDQVKDVYKKNKKNPEVIIGIAQSFYNVKDTANAQKYIELALKANKKYAPAYVLLGDIAAYNNDGGQAAAQYQQAIYFDPKSPEAYYKYANVYRKISPSEAVAKLEELRAQRPDINVDAMAGRIYYISNEFDKANDSYGKAFASMPDKMKESELTDYALSLYFTKKYQKSLEVSKYGLGKVPRDAAFNRLALYNCTELKDYDNALVYADALFNKSDSAKITFLDYGYYGNAYVGKQDYAHAIEVFEKALTLPTDNVGKQASILSELAAAYKQTENFEKAVETYKKYLEAVGKPSATDRVSLAQLYVLKASKDQTLEARNADLDAAIEVYQKLAQDEPDAVEYATFKTAQTYSYKDPDSKEGLSKPYYEKLIQLIEAHAEKDEADKARLVEAYRYLGSYYYIVKNNKAQADPYFRKILEIEPDNKTAKQALGIK